MDRSEFFQRVNRCIDKIDLRYVVSDDPDEEAEIYVADDGFLYFEEVKSPFTVDNVVKIKYSQFDEEKEQDSAVNLYLDNDTIISFGMNCRYDYYLSIYFCSNHKVLEEDAMFAYFNALNNGSAFLVKDKVLYDYIGQDSVIKIPDDVVFIEGKAFSGNEFIKEIEFSKDVEEIRDAYCFGGMANLEKVTLNDGLKTIGWSAFSRCKNLRKIKIPSTVEKINSFAFNGSGIVDVEIQSDGIVFGEGVFKDTPYDEKMDLNE